MDGDEECLYQAIPKLWPIGEISPEELKFLPEVYVKMAQPEENINYLLWYYQHECGKTLILEKSIDTTIKNKQITRWTFTVNEQLSKLIWTLVKNLA
jgi:hypothetical protein